MCTRVYSRVFENDLFFFIKNSIFCVIQLWFYVRRFVKVPEKHVFHNCLQPIICKTQWYGRKRITKIAIFWGVQKNAFFNTRAQPVICKKCIFLHFLHISKTAKNGPKTPLKWHKTLVFTMFFGQFTGVLHRLIPYYHTLYITTVFRSVSKKIVRAYSRVFVT